MNEPDFKQYRELMKLMLRPADRDDCISIIRDMPNPPGNEESLLAYLREKIEPHSRMWGENKAQWRKQFYSVLPFRQCKRYVEKMLGQTNWFRGLMSSLSVSNVNHTESWAFKQFWQYSLKTRCKCGATNQVDTSESHQRMLRYNCPDIEEEHVPFLQGRSKEDARSFILNASLYRLMKLGTKYRCYREPQYELLYKSGSQFFKLCSETEPSCGRRKQNVFILSLMNALRQDRIT